MPVTIIIDKLIRIDTLLSELSAAGFMRVSYRPAEFVTVEDSDNEPGVRAVYTAHDASRLTPQEQAEKDAITNYGTLADWARTGTAAEAETYINAQVWNGQTTAQVNAWIDANITGTTIAALRAQIITALKVTASAVINMRGLFILTAKLLFYIRDLVIRFRGV